MLTDFCIASLNLASKSWFRWKKWIYEGGRYPAKGLGLEKVKDMEVETGRRAAGLSKWKALHQRRGIPSFSSRFFCYSLERVPYSSHWVLCHCWTSGQIKEERKERGRGGGWGWRRGGTQGESECAETLSERNWGREACSWCCFKKWFLKIGEEECGGKVEFWRRKEETGNDT